jgi:tRNA threonylcarbamoyl adenosine modification protein YeaZ
MKFLALELSSGQGSVAWLNDDGESFVQTFSNDRRHSGMFFEKLREWVDRFGAPDSLVVGLGPGSYAGVRIAIAAAIGLQAAYGAQLIGVPSLCGLETDAHEYGVIGDARRQSFFYARVKERECVEGPTLRSEVELRSVLEAGAIPVYASEPLAQFPQATLAYPSAVHLAQIVRRGTNNVSLPPLEPIYLREPHITVPKALFGSPIIS